MIVALFLLTASSFCCVLVSLQPFSVDREEIEVHERAVQEFAVGFMVMVVK